MVLLLYLIVATLTSYYILCLCSAVCLWCSRQKCFCHCNYGEGEKNAFVQILYPKFILTMLIPTTKHKMYIVYTILHTQFYFTVVEYELVYIHYTLSVYILVKFCFVWCKNLYYGVTYIMWLLLKHMFLFSFNFVHSLNVIFMYIPFCSKRW